MVSGLLKLLTRAVVLRTAPGALVLVMTAFGALAAGLNLTPVLEEYENDGLKFRQLVFKQENGKVTLQLPTAWNHRADGNRVQLLPHGKSFSEGVIEAVPIETPVAWDTTTWQRLQEQSLATVPAGSQDVSVLRTEENPVLLGGNPSFETVVTYKALGQVFHRSVVYVNGPDFWLIFRFTAPKPDFDALHAEFRRAVMSWRSEGKPVEKAPR